MKDLRSVVVKVVVVSFSLAALLGIATLLGADALGETGGKVLGTTFVVGVESLAVLCYLAVAGTRRAPLGVAGGVISLVPFALSLWLIWVDVWVDETAGDVLWRTLGVGVTLAASLAQACLLSAVTERPRPRVQALLAATFAAITVLAAMIIVPIVLEPDVGDWYWRILGIVAILDVLGTVLVIALQKFTAGPSAPAPAGASSLSPAASTRLAEAAHHRGTTPSALLEELLDGLPPR